MFTEVRTLVREKMMEPGPSTGPPAVASGLFSFNSGLTGFLGSMRDSLNTALGEVTEGLKSFNEGTRGTAFPILDAVGELGRTVETLGYTAMAFDRKGISGVPNIIKAGIGAQQQAGRIAERLETESAGIDEVLDSAGNFDPVSVGREAYRRLNDRRGGDGGSSSQAQRGGTPRKRRRRRRR